jgi:hypothetical protein
VRRLLTWLSGAAGGIALYRWLTRERPVAEVPDAALDPRAAELRARLEESRALVDERERFEAGETAVDEAEPTPDPAERRRRVHEHGRAAVDEMRRSAEP